MPSAGLAQTAKDGKEAVVANDGAFPLSSKRFGRLETLSINRNNTESKLVAADPVAAMEPTWTPAGQSLVLRKIRIVPAAT